MNPATHAAAASFPGLPRADAAVRGRVLRPPELSPDIAAKVAPLWWPMERLGDAIVELARHGGLPVATLSLGPDMQPPTEPADVPRWIGWAADRMGLEAESIDCAVPDLPRLLRQAGPALVPYTDPKRGHGYLLLLSGGDRLRLLSPDGEVRRCEVQTLRSALCWSMEAPLMPELAGLLREAKVPAERRHAVVDAMLRQRLVGQRFGVCSMLRLPATAPFWQQLRHVRLPSQVCIMLAIFAVMFVLELAGWRLIGDAVLEGRLDMGLMAAWLLMMLSMIPLRLLAEWLDASFALEAGRLLKSRLLYGSLRMNPDTVQRQGVGHLLGRVIESQALESLAVGGGLGALVALLELGVACWVLTMGAGGALHGLLLVGWLFITGLLGWIYFDRLKNWTLHRLGLTHELIERMVGHRTRLAQERPGRRDLAEDASLDAYQQASWAMDRASVPLHALIPAGWLVVGLIGLMPAFVTGSGTTAGLAISLGGILLAQRALGAITDNLSNMAGAVVAWRQVSALFKAGHRPPESQPFLPSHQLSGDRTAGALIDAHGLQFSYSPGSTPALKGVNLHIHKGERILLEGSSGGGKSTLAAVLTGLRKPQSGLLLLNGLDRHTLGELWHQLATSAPQFNENHVMTGTLGFNLLMGRDWPASPPDLAEARALCDELGLGELLARMPAGLMQHVGETGWQLSHGERSRIFLARALLQKAPLTVLDESFAALDPQTLEQCLRCAFDRCQTLIVIAHP